MKKVVVFGGSGFLGSYVADELTDRGYEVLIADIKESAYLKESQQGVICDIMRPSDIEAVIKDATLVYNFAGLADIDQSTYLPRKTIEQNIIGTLNILEASKAVNLERFVYASSAYALSNKGGIYGISKLAAEKIVEEYNSRFSIPFSIIRYGSLYGERADKHNGVYQLLRQAIETGVLHIRSDGEDVREYIHAADAAELSVDIIQDEKFINTHSILTGLERMRKRDFAMMIKEILNDNISVTFSDEPLDGHYQITPYSYQPSVARKLVSNSFFDLGQGLVSCIKCIHEEIGNEKKERIDK